MTPFQKTVKYLAIAFAIFLTVSILGGVFSVLGLFAGFFGSDAVTEDTKTYTVSSDIRNLEVKINAADFTVKQGDSFCVESNLKHLAVKEENGVLTIRETQKFSKAYTGAVLTLYIPADTVLETASITTGAGRLTADQLSAAAMHFEFGAGEVTIGTLTATSNADIDGGAGKITISGGALHDLDLDMGVGQLNLTAALTGESEFDLGVGESNITVIGNKDDYKLDMEKGIGDITVNGKSISGLKEQGIGSHRIEISGGIGAIHLAFTTQ